MLGQQVANVIVQVVKLETRTNGCESSDENEKKACKTLLRRRHSGLVKSVPS